MLDKYGERVMNKWFRLVATIAIGLQTAGCWDDYGPVARIPEPILPAANVANRIQAGNVVKVSVYGEDGLTGSYTVDPSGNIRMPLVGGLRAEGFTKDELEREITRRYASGNFLQDPKVIVDVVSFQPIYILGETLRPGAYPYSSGLNVLTALTLAGGPTYRASRSSILIQHAGETNWQEYPLTAAVTIAPGDLIRVPERYF
jgi:protein involved in polysaccharide export with SLBB domain